MFLSIVEILPLHVQSYMNLYTFVAVFPAVGYSQFGVILDARSELAFKLN